MNPEHFISLVGEIVFLFLYTFRISSQFKMIFGLYLVGDIAFLFISTFHISSQSKSTFVLQQNHINVMHALVFCSNMFVSLCTHKVNLLMFGGTAETSKSNVRGELHRLCNTVNNAKSSSSSAKTKTMIFTTKLNVFWALLVPDLFYPK